MDRRLATTPILTRGNVSALIGASEKDVRAWSSGPEPAVQRPRKAGGPLTVPFVGLVEADLLKHLEQQVTRRQAQYLVRSLRRKDGDLSVLEAPRLVTDGSHMFIQHGEDLTRTTDRQTAHLGVVGGFLRNLTLDQNNRVAEYRPERMPFTSVNPRFNGGGLSLTESRVPVFAVVGCLRGGDSPAAVAEDYRIPLELVQAIERDLDWAEAAA